MLIVSPVPKDDPLMKAWETYQQSAAFENAKHWAVDPNHVDGSLWSAFEHGFRAATERASDLHEQIDSASDAERLEGIPGAGAMGAVIEYRDRIRQTVAS